MNVIRSMPTRVFAGRFGRRIVGDGSKEVMVVVVAGIAGMVEEVCVG